MLDDDHVDIVVNGAKLRALLALLALEVGRPVPSDRLIDALWGEDPPPAVRNSLQGLVSKLRRALGSPSIVSMRGTGYALQVPPDAVDVHLYEQLVAAARAATADGNLVLAVVHLAEADALWRGSPLADFAYDDWATAEIGRLTEQRLAAIEESLGLELALGRHHAAVINLEALVAAHPLREALRALLMVALYRTGRQADALRIFQEGRHVLADELGLEPGPELRRVESAILTQDPSLDAPAVTAQSSGGEPRARIPEPLTAIVGRVNELSDLRRLFGEHRLLTLVGPGGVGKTRLALELARSEAATLACGAVLVELARVGDPTGVRTAIASALDLPDPDRLVEMIGDRELLLVLDNCEHVIVAAAEVAERLLLECTALHVIATSREGLRVGGEAIWPVPPLPAADAVQLFLTRAKAAGGQEEMGDPHLIPAIADICARLDGLPLAVELAAARTRTFPIEQIASRLHDRFRLLTGGSRTALPRQQTLRAVVDWSYELLFNDEQRVLERLSVFPGGCDLATIEIVCADETLAPDDLADIVHALVEKSLVIAVPEAGYVRFSQLQTLAHYGREKLAERGGAERVRDAMATYFASLCRESADAYMGPRQRAWLATIDRERDNLRAALDWAVANDDAETALAIAGGASWPHWLGATVAEGRKWLDDAFTCGGEASERTRALALIGRGLLDFQAGVTEDVDANLEAALAISTSLDDVPTHVLAQSFYAEVAAVRGDIDEARKRRLQVLAFYGRLPDDPFVRAARAYSTAKLAVLDGDLARAERYFRDATEGFAAIDRPVMYSMCLDTVAEFDERAGHQAAAIARLEESIATSVALGVKGFAGSVLVRLAWLLLQDGDLERAKDAFADALDSSRWLAHAPVVFLSLAGLASIDRLQGRDEAAERAATEALEIYLAGGPRRFKNRVHAEREVPAAAAACCTVLGVLAAHAGKWDRSPRLLGHADRLRRDCGAAVPTFQCPDIARAETEIVAAIGRDAFAAAFADGARGRLEDVGFRL